MAKPNEGVPEFLAKLGVKPAEWQYAAKKDWRLLMRPGWDLRVRVYACLQEFTRGYRGEFAMMQVGRAAEGDPPKFVPVTSTAISARLLKVAVEEFRKSGKDPRADERHRMRVRGPHMRRMIESMECDDGALSRVTATKYLAPDEATRKLAPGDVLKLMSGLSYDEARAQKLIVPIRELAKKDRKRLNGKSFMYVHVNYRPATVAALMRRTDDDITLSRTSKEIHVELTAAAQLAFRFLRAEGVNDPQFAEQLSRLPVMAAYVDQLVKIEMSLANVKGAIREYVHPLAEAHKQGEEIVLPPATAVQPDLPLYGPPALVPPPQPAAELPPVKDYVTATEFNNALCVRFHDVRAGLPTRKQTDDAYNTLGADAGRFLNHPRSPVSPTELQRRKPNHGGILTSLVEEWQRSGKLGPAPAAEESMWERLAREQEAKVANG